MANPYLIDEKDVDLQALEAASVNRPPITTGAPVPDSNIDPYQVGVLPNQLGLPTDVVKTQLRGGPIFRLMPPPPAGQAQNNSSNTSSLLKDPVFQEVQTQTATNTTEIAAQSLTGWQGSWVSSVNYSLGAIVETGGTVYVSLQNQNLGNAPASSPAFWQATGTDVFLGPWNSATAYVVGDIVSVGTALYIAIANSTNENPTTTSGFWSVLTGNSVYEGMWVSTTAYSPGQTVSYTDGNFYICIVANTNVPPAPTGSTDWVLLGTSNTLIGAWSSSTAYIAGNQVTNAGFIFQALQANTNQTPPTPPATSAYWILVGPAHIDPSTSYVLAKGSTPLTLNTGLSYTSTTSAIDLIWEALALYRADGTITTIGTGSQNITGLGSGRTFYVFPFWNEATATFGFVNNSNVSFPTLKGIAYTNAGNEYATTTTGAALPSAFTLSLWVQVASGYAGAGGLTINTSHTTVPLSSINSVLNFEWNTGAITAGYRDSGGTFHTLTSPQTYNDGEFHHVCYVCDPTNSSQVLYVDGVSVATGSVATAVSATSGFFWLNRGASNITMTGTLTEIAFFNSALSATNAMAIYNAGNSISQTALETVITSFAPTIWWKSTDAGPTTLADSGSIGGNTGTAVNSPTFGTTSPVFGAIGVPQIAWPSRSLLVTQFQNLQGNVGFTVGGWAISTTSTGTGGGTNGGSSGGSGAGCYSPDTKIQTPNGPVAISDLQVGDFVISHGGVCRKVLAVLRHEKAIRTMIDTGNGLVTPNHIVADGDEWTSAGELFKNNPKIKFDGEVFNLTISGDTFDEHSYTLASGVLSHNGKVV
jgi:hypothetical protein